MSIVTIDKFIFIGTLTQTLQKSYEKQHVIEDNPKIDLHVIMVIACS